MITGWIGALIGAGALGCTEYALKDPPPPKPATPPMALCCTPSQRLPAAASKKCPRSPLPKANAATPIAATATTFAAVNNVATLPVAPIDAQLMSVTNHSAPSATIVKPRTAMPSASGNVSQVASSAPFEIALTKMANPTASAACEPVFMIANTVQP